SSIVHHATPPAELYTLSLHDALTISRQEGDHPGDQPTHGPDHRGDQEGDRGCHTGTHRLGQFGPLGAQGGHHGDDRLVHLRDLVVHRRGHHPRLGDGLLVHLPHLGVEPAWEFSDLIDHLPHHVGDDGVTDDGVVHVLDLADRVVVEGLDLLLGSVDEALDLAEDPVLEFVELVDHGRLDPRGLLHH